MHDGTAMRAYTGCRTTAEREARGKGIEVFDIGHDGAWTHLQHVSTAANPSFLCLDAAGDTLHCVHGDGSEASSFRIDAVSGRLAALGRQSTGGRNPVHLAYAPGGRWMAVANYASGSVASLPVLPDGALGPAAHVIALPGQPGPHRTQQTGAHPHQVVFDPPGRWLLVPDKGGDAVHTLRWDAANGILQVSHSLALPAGSGPRHLVFDPRGLRLWLVCELGSQVIACEFDATHGTLRPLQRVPSVPDDFVGDNTAAGIAIAHDARLLCVSNRGHGSVACWSIDPATGTLHSPHWRVTGGRVPRFIAMDARGNTLVAANEDADTVVRIGIDIDAAPPATLTRTGSPVCIVFQKGMS